MNFKGILKRAVVPLVVVALLLCMQPGTSGFRHTFFRIPGRLLSIWGSPVLIVYLIGLGRLAVGNSLSDEVRDAALILTIVLVLLIGGWILTGAASTLAAEALRPAALHIAILWSAACFMAGFLTGFLFGVPKFGAGDASPKKPACPARSGASSAQGYSQRPNTNLEQISDWLTKIIVGLGLVELKQIPTHLGNAARWGR